MTNIITTHIYPGAREHTDTSHEHRPPKLAVFGPRSIKIEKKCTAVHLVIMNVLWTGIESYELKGTELTRGTQSMHGCRTGSMVRPG